MSRAKLIKQLKEKNPQLNRYELENVLNILTESISFTLKNGGEVEIRGLGRWYCKKIKENFNARNPKTNELIYKPERLKVKFKSSKKLIKEINK